MKKLIALTLALALCLGLGVTALAEDTTLTQDSASGSTEINYSVTNGATGGDTASWVVTIPATVTVPTDVSTGAGLTVAITQLYMPTNQALHVTITSANSYCLTTESGSSVAYYIYKNYGTDEQTELSSHDSDESQPMLQASGLAKSLEKLSSGYKINRAAGFLRVYGQGWLTAAEGSCALYLTTTVDDLNSATASGLHTDTLTFTCSIIGIDESNELIMDS